jgi:zinc protease
MANTETKLSNGLRVIVREKRDNPVVTVDAWVNTGSRAEPPALAGVSHFLEHMLFKGTEKRRKPNEIDRLVEEIGGDWNAGTSKDFTHYYCTVAAPFRELAMEVVSDILRSSLIDAGELEKERQVILEEWRRSQDNPGDLLGDEIYLAAYAAGPYRENVLGTKESIEGIDRAGMVDYFERYYAPENIALVVAGDLSFDEAIRLAERHFGDWKRTFRPLANPLPPTKRNRGQRVVLEKDFEETYLAIATPGPSIRRQEDVLAADLLDIIMGGGYSSRLHQRLVEDKRLAHGVSAQAGVHRDDGLFFVSAALDGEKLDAFRGAIWEEFRRFRDDGPTPRELERAKTMLFTSEAFSTETTTGRTGNAGYLYTLTGSTELEETYLDRIKAVTADDLVRVARECLDEEAANEVIIQPRRKDVDPRG